MSEKRFNDPHDPLTLEELSVKVIELDERVTRLETLIEEFRKTGEELKDEMRELRMVMIGGFIAVIAASILLKLLG